MSDLQFAHTHKYILSVIISMCSATIQQTLSPKSRSAAQVHDEQNICLRDVHGNQTLKAALPCLEAGLVMLTYEGLGLQPKHGKMLAKVENACSKAEAMGEPSSEFQLFCRRNAVNVSGA